MSHTIAQVKSLLEAWTPVVIFDIVDNNDVHYYWAKQVVTWGGHMYDDVITDHSEMKIDKGVFGVPAVPQIQISVNNADVSMGTIITRENFVGADITIRLIFVEPYTQETTSNSICFGKFQADAPSSSYPKIEFSAWNKLNFTRKSLPLRTVTVRDCYPFPSDAAEREAAYSDPASKFYANGYNPDHSRGNYAILSTACTAGTSASSVVVAGEDFDVTVPIGLEIKFLDGPAAGLYSKVFAKTATTLGVYPYFAISPVAGNHFVAYYTAESYNGLRGPAGDPYDPDNTGADVPGTSVCLETIGLSVRFGGCISKAPPTINYVVQRGQTAPFKGAANEACAGQVVPLHFGRVRTTPMVLLTGAPPNMSGVNGAVRESYLLLCDGVNFDTMHDGASGIDQEGYTQGNFNILYHDKVILPAVKDGKDYVVPQQSNNGNITGGWLLRPGYFGSAVNQTNKYRNIDPAVDFPLIGGKQYDFTDRDLFSGLAHLQVMLPNELSNGQSDAGPRTDVIFRGLWIELWDHSLSSNWAWSDNPVWILWHLLKLLGWDPSEIDKDAMFHAADYCDVYLGTYKRFRCNLRLEEPTKVVDIIRGICSNCRMYFTYNSAGQLQFKIEKTSSEEGGTTFAIDSTNIVRDSSGNLMIKKWSKSVQETANTYSITFQDEENDYLPGTETDSDIENIAKLGKVDGGSLTTILGIPNHYQARRQLNWVKINAIDCNEYYNVRGTMALVEQMVGQLGTITDVQNSLSGQYCRLQIWTPNPDGTVDLVLQMHKDSACSDTNVLSPLIKATSDSNYSPRSAGAVSGSSGNPTLVETFALDSAGAGVVRRITASFSVPPTTFESKFSTRTKLTGPASVYNYGGSIPPSQVLFVEVCPQVDGVDGLPSNELLVDIGFSGGALHKFEFVCQLPIEATHYTVRIGSFPGKLYKHSTEVNTNGTTPFSISITSISSLDSSSLSPDPKFDHVRAFYYYDSKPYELKDGGRTLATTQTTFTFEPETPAVADTTITVIICSANGDESDFYPINNCPLATLALTKDTAPPVLPNAFGANLAASSNGLAVLAGVIATDQVRSIVQGEFLFKFTDQLVTSLDMSTGTVKIIKTAANSYGLQGNYVAEKPGRVFIDCRLLNVAGWSNYLSGGAAPGTSTFYVDTKIGIDTGPPAGWYVVLEDHGDDPAIPPSKIRAKAVLTGSNLANLLWIAFQIKDSSAGSWREVDANAGAAVTYYDGSAISHSMVDGGIHIARDSGTGFTGCSVGDLILLDVRGGTFGINYCQWGTIVDFLDSSNNPIAVGSATRLLVQGRFRPQATTNLRIKIVKPPWTWVSEGYLGAAGCPKEGELFVTGSVQKTFYSGLIDIGATKTSLDVRAWIENHYCRSDSSSVGGSSPTVSVSAASVNDIPDRLITPGGVTTKRIEIDSTNGMRVYDDTNNLMAQIPLLTTGGGIFQIIKLMLMPTWSTPFILSGDNGSNGNEVDVVTGEGDRATNASGVFLTHGPDGTITLKINNTAVATITKDGITIATNKTVDGVDISAHNASATQHGVTGSVMGTNMTNSPGSAFTLLCQANGKIGPRSGTHATDWPTTSDCADGEMLHWWNQAVGNRLYLRNGSNMFYVSLNL